MNISDKHIDYAIRICFAGSIICLLICAYGYWSMKHSPQNISEPIINPVPSISSIQTASSNRSSGVTGMLSLNDIRVQSIINQR